MMGLLGTDYKSEYRDRNENKIQKMSKKGFLKHNL